jgi:tripartite-type tricarboxylate transporter receptor subunit TctC
MRLKSILFVVAALMCLSHKAGAEDYPDRPIRLIVPTGAGGAADIVSRMIAEKIQTSLHQTVIVDDRPGANGIVGASYVLSAPADGYMLMMGHIGLMTINSHIYKDMKFNPLTDFAPVTRATTYSDVLVVNNNLPVHSVAELIQYAKKNSDALQYSSNGFGGSFHMAFELLKTDAGINAEHVPYTGTAKALTGVIAGNVNVAFTDAIVAAPQIAANTVRGIAISGKTRSKMLPNIPTIAESGVPGLADFDVVGWNGIVVKAGTPPERIKLLNDHIRRALTSPDVMERISKLGADVAVDTPEEFGEFMRIEDTKWGGLVTKAKLGISN